MGGPEHEEPAGGEEHEGWLPRILGWGGMAHTAAETGEVVHAGGSAATLMHHAAAEGGTGLGNWLGPLALGSGIHEMINGKTTIEKVGGGLEAGSGAIGTLGLAGAGLNAAGSSLAAAGFVGDLGAASGAGLYAGAGMATAGEAMTGAAVA